MSKIVVLDAGRDDKEVVRQVASSQVNDALVWVDACYLIQKDMNVFPMTEDGTQRARDFVLREQPRRHLVQHRAKEMIIPFINQRHANLSIAQGTSRGESSEAATDNDNPR